MALITPESSPADPDRQASSAHLLSAPTMLSSPLMSTNACNTTLFCCDNLYPLTHPHGPHEQAIYHFAYYMVNTTSSPTPRTYLPATHSKILEEACYVIRFQRWMNGEKGEIRHFMPHPNQDTTFIELKQSTLAASSRKEKWIPNWRYLKFRCDIHQGPWFICYVLERRDWREEVVRLEVRSVKRKRNAEAENEREEILSFEEEEPQYSSTCKSVKRQ
ncbi:hypothetical protein WAI453_002805 [Rhynchosporium graminicola]